MRTADRSRSLFRSRGLIATLFPMLAMAAVPARRAAGQPQPRASRRIDVPFTLSVKTPHVPWAKPFSGPPVHAFVVPSVSEGRTLVELAERMDLTFRTVTIDDAWDVNTWTIGTDQNYEARNYKLVYRYLEEDLTAPQPYDVIVLPSLHGWNRLPRAARAAITRRVARGSGLVLIHPMTGLPAPDDPKVEGPLNEFADSREVAGGEELWALSPLVGVHSDRLDGRGYRQIRPHSVLAGKWRRVGQHFITANLPLESFPVDFLKHYKYQLGKHSTLLVVGGNGEPIVATKLFGKGRVVALGYVNAGLSPMIDLKALGHLDDRWWEYFYSLLCRSILWAAKRTPEFTLGRMEVRNGTEGRTTLWVTIGGASSPEPVEIKADFWNEWGESEGSVTRRLTVRPGPNSISIQLPAEVAAGRHFADVTFTSGGKHHDWGSVSFDVNKPDEILSVSTDREFYARGDRIAVRFTTRARGPVRSVVDLLDNRGRLLDRSADELREVGESGALVFLTAGNYTTQIGWVRVTLLDSRAGGDRKIDRKRARVNFAALDRDFGAYELIMPWYGPPSYQPWTPVLDEQFRKVGVTVMESPERNFRLIREIQTPGFGVYWHYRQDYLRQKDKFLESGDNRYLIREPDLANERWLDELRGRIREAVGLVKGFRPLAYYLADESSLTAYGDPFDLSWSAPTLEKFREWLKSQYSDLAALNQEWETRYQRWEEVQPLTTAEAQAKGNYAGWMDHRTFMEQVFARAILVAADAVRAEDPGSRPSISGTQSPGPSNAVNWYLLDQVIDYLQPYSQDDQDELHRTMRPGQLLTGFTGYERHGAALRHEIWHRLFHGQIGASVFWHYTLLNPDLTLTEQGRDLAKTVREIREEGLALLLGGAARENCGIAVHYSLLSVRGQWITDGRIQPREVSNGDATSAHLRRFHANRHAWLQALEDAGYQYDFLTTEQIEDEKLAGYKALVLPASIALSDGEVAAIRRFVEGGGTLIADAETGLMDGHGRWQPAGRLDDLLGVRRAQVGSAPDRLRPVAWTAGGVGRTPNHPVIPAHPDLRAAARPSEADTRGAELLVQNRFGKGRALTLNFWMMDYENLRKSRAEQPRLALLRAYLHGAGMAPVADIRKASGEPLRCSELIAYRKASASYLAVLPEPRCDDAGGALLNLPAPQYVYDLRAHRALGHVAHVRVRLVPGEPAIYGFVPGPVNPVKVVLMGSADGSAEVRLGDTVKLSIQLAPGLGSASSGGGEGRDGMVWDSAVRMEVRDPAGEILDHYGMTVALVNGAAEFAVPLALNDRAGPWRVTAREPFTHQTASATFVVAE